LLCELPTSTRSAGASGARQGTWPPPVEKLAPWATAWEGLLPVLRMHTLLERSYSTRTTMKRTNFPLRFDKPDFNLSQSLYSSPKLRSYPHPDRSHNPHQNCLKLYSLTLQETCQIHKRQSNCEIAFNISKLLSESRELQKFTEAVASIDQNRGYPLSKPVFLNNRSAVNDVNFQQTLPREAFWHA